MPPTQQPATTAVAPDETNVPPAPPVASTPPPADAAIAAHAKYDRKD